MKLRFYIGFVLMAVLAGCGERLHRHAATHSECFRNDEGTATHEALVEIDSLMWQQPDSALGVMMEFAASPKADNLNELRGIIARC